MMKKISFLFLVFLGISLAVTVNADFTANPPLDDYHFATNMMLNPDFKVSFVSGQIISGNPTDLASGSRVCPGTVLRVEPEPEAKWAVSYLNAKVLYPYCDPVIYSYCPQMMSAGSLQQNRDIIWLPAGVFNNYQSIGFSNDFQFAIDGENSFDDLSGYGAFAAQPVTYENLPLVPTSPNKRGQSGVLCKGNLRVLRDGQQVGGDIALPSSATKEITLSSVGSHTVRVELRNTDCFASVAKRPLDRGTQWFRINYFARNAPTISPASAAESKNIIVEQAATPCDFSMLQSVYYDTRDANIYLVVATVQNTGSQPLVINSVSSFTLGYTATPLNPTLCAGLGLPPSLCPAANGFGETVQPTQTNDYFIIVDTQGGDINNAALRLNGQSTVTNCGVQGTCGETFVPNPSGDVVMCEIDPPTLVAGRLIAYEWLVTCYDAGNNVVPCVGNNWYFGGGLSGIFIERTNTHAIAGSDSPIGSTGTLDYESGQAHCQSDLTIVDPSPWLVCEFDPSSANMQVGDQQYFDLTCYWDGQEVTINDADYGLGNGLVGSLSNESIDGVTFEGTQNSSGILWGIGWYQHPSLPDMVGGIAIADIIVGSGGNGNNETNGNGEDDEEEDCIITGPDPLAAWPGWHGDFQIWCGENFDQHCSPVVSWTYSGAGSLTNADEDGATLTVAGTLGDSEVLRANLPDGGFCTKIIEIGLPSCWEFS